MRWGDLKSGDVLHYEDVIRSRNHILTKEPESYLVLGSSSLDGVLSQCFVVLDLLNLDDGARCYTYNKRRDETISICVHVDRVSRNQ